MIHPEHNRVAAALRTSNRTSDPAMGYFVERRPFGCYCRNLHVPELARIMVENVTPDQVPALLSDASAYFGPRKIELWLEDHPTENLLAPALISVGCTGGEALTYLAYVGAPPIEKPLSGVRIEEIDAARMEDYALVKVKGFSNSEAEPAAAVLQHEVAARLGDRFGPGRFLLARVAGEAAAVVGFYEGEDRLVFNLATRVPFRNRGVAKYLLCRVIADSYERGRRAVVINTNPDDTPIQWYRRLGFSDEVGWHRSFFYGARQPNTSH